MKTKHRARRLSVRFSPPGDSPRTIDVFHSTASSPPTPPPREVHPIASIPTEPSPFPPIRVRPPESRVSPNADSKSFATNQSIQRNSTPAQSRGNERTMRNSRASKEIPSKQTNHPRVRSVRDRIRTHLMTDCPIRRPRSAVASFRRRRRTVQPSLGLGRTEPIASSAPPCLTRTYGNRFIDGSRFEFSTRPHRTRTPFFFPSYGLRVPMQIRVDARLCIFYIGVSQLWDVVLLSCFVNASLDSSFRP